MYVYGITDDNILISLLHVVARVRMSGSVSPLLSDIFHVVVLS